MIQMDGWEVSRKHLTDISVLFSRADGRGARLRQRLALDAAALWAAPTRKTEAASHDPLTSVCSEVLLLLERIFIPPL